MTKRSTKSSLILSAISLLLCASMLIGTTFAWFTDSVTSTGNKIQSGTLVLDLEMYDEANTTADKYASIKDSKAPIFNYDKWEPGYTAVRLLKVENEGTLALKWYAKFVSETKAADLANLADVIDVYVCPSATALTMPDRDLTGYDKVGTLRTFLNTIETTTYGTLMPDGEAGDEAYLGIALKMQESAGNEYQDKTIGAFDIQILATQYTYEEDSFDKNYDIDATFPIVVNEKVDDTTGKTIEAKDNGGNVLVAVGVPAGAAEYELNISEPIVTENNGESIVTLDITLYKDGVEVDAPAGVTYPVTVNVGAGLVINKVLHKTEEITAFNYDVFTGELSFETDSFSPFSVAYREVEAGENNNKNRMF